MDYRDYVYSIKVFKTTACLHFFFQTVTSVMGRREQAVCLFRGFKQACCCCSCCFISKSKILVYSPAKIHIVTHLRSCMGYTCQRVLNYLHRCTLRIQCSHWSWRHWSPRNSLCETVWNRRDFWLVARALCSRSPTCGRCRTL